MEGVGFKISVGYNFILIYESVLEEKYESICNKMLMWVIIKWWDYR